MSDTQKLELFLPIPGYELLYHVSNKGQVMSVQRKCKLRGNLTRTVNQKMLSHQKSTYGHWVVYLSKNGSKRAFGVHTLMAMAFTGHRTNKRTVVDHINRIPTDNRLENLRLVSYSANQMNRNTTSTNKSGRTGVCFDPDTNKWLAYIGINRNMIPLGSFISIEDAIQKRQSAEEKFWKKQHTVPLSDYVSH